MEETKSTFTKKVDNVVENTYIKLGVRLFPFVIAVVGWLIVHQIALMEASIKETKATDIEARKAMWEAQRLGIVAVNGLASTVAVLSKTVEANRERSDVADTRQTYALDKLDRKLELILQAPPKP